MTGDDLRPAFRLSEAVERASALVRVLAGEASYNNDHITDADIDEIYNGDRPAADIDEMGRCIRAVLDCAYALVVVTGPHGRAVIDAVSAPEARPIAVGPPAETWADNLTATLAAALADPRTAHAVSGFIDDAMVARLAEMSSGES